MINYTFRKLNLLVITFLVLTLISYSVTTIDTSIEFASGHFFAGWTSYLGDISQLNFGINPEGIPVFDELKIVFPATLELCLLAFIIALFIGIPIGTIAGMKQGKWTDTAISFTTMCGYSAPIYWVALLLILIFSLNYELLPVSGRYDLLYKMDHVTGFALIDAFISNDSDRAALLQSVIEHMILPCSVLSLLPTTQIIRMMRASVSEVMNQNYIRVARIRGLSQYQIVFQHVLRNSIPPIIPRFGVVLSTMFTLSFVTESVFNWPGIGRWLLDALADKDYESVQAGVLVIATLVLSVNIISDLVGAIVNPLARKAWYANK